MVLELTGISSETMDMKMLMVIIHNLEDLPEEKIR